MNRRDDVLVVAFASEMDPNSSEGYIDQDSNCSRVRLK